MRRQRRQLVAWVNLLLLGVIFIVARAQPEEERRLLVAFAGGVIVLFLWVIVIPAADLAIHGPVNLRDRRERRRRAAHLCLSCGYSLHGNVSGVCPECGTPVRP